MIASEKYQPARQNMKFVTRFPHSQINFMFWLRRPYFR